jgi:integrase/recombinase XerD
VLTEFLTWCATTPAPGFTKATVQNYRAALAARGLSASAINVQLAVIRKFGGRGHRQRTACPALAAGIANVPGTRAEGPRAGNWLTRDQACRLLSLPDIETGKGKRDRAILGLLVGCGLRRDELVRLTVEEIQQREAGG